MSAVNDDSHPEEPYPSSESLDGGIGRADQQSAGDDSQRAPVSFRVQRLQGELGRQGRKLVVRTIIAGTGAVALALLWFAYGRKTADLERLEKLTYDQATPYLEARFTVREGRIWLCTPDNFAKLPRDPLLEGLSRETAAVFDGTGRMFPRLIDFSRFGYEDSPWGTFKDPRMREVLLPSFEEAKKRLLATMRAEQGRQGDSRSHAGSP